jgi:hypothetical protein
LGRSRTIIPLGGMRRWVMTGHPDVHYSPQIANKVSRMGVNRSNGRRIPRKEEEVQPQEQPPQAQALSAAQAPPLSNGKRHSSLGRRLRNHCGAYFFYCWPHRLRLRMLA